MAEGFTFTMSRLSESTTVPKALRALDKMEWLPHLEELADRFEGMETSEGEKGIDRALETTIWDLVTLREHSASAPVTRLLHRRVAELDCWLHRTARETAAGSEFWDPLSCSFTEFCAEHQVHSYMAEHAYPARDVIRQWCKQRLT
jgi:hypothetical protein